MNKTPQIDDKLVRAAKQLTGEEDERAAVERVLRRSLDVRRKNEALLELVGHVEFHEGYDPRAVRFFRHDPESVRDAFVADHGHFRR